MSLNPKYFDQRMVREIMAILIIKVIVLMLIKHIWFNAPTIPKEFDSQVAEHIAGTPTQLQETR